MKFTRRQFMKVCGLSGLGLMGSLGGGVLNPPKASASYLVPQIPLPGKSITKYANAMPTFVGQRFTGTNLTISVEEFLQQVLPSPFPQTRVWGYKIVDNTNAVTRGPLFPTFTVEARRGQANTVTYVNNLPANPLLQPYLTVDQTIHWADPYMQMGLTVPYQGPQPITTHLHGGEVRSDSDGHPDSWFTPGMGITGPGFVSNVYTYPNAQEPATLWFHDHALGITRLNVYAGLAGFYFLRDPNSLDTGLVTAGGLPAGPQEIEIVIQDRQFDTTGQLLFPDGYPAGFNGPPPNPTVHPFWNPEFFGDVIVVNGMAWPFLSVEPRRYRLRFLNGSNARFYSLNLGSKLPFWQIGTDGGLLDAPVKVSQLFIAPGERADVIVDFKATAGQNIVMTNSAKAPFPKGMAADPQTTGQIMQFRIGTTVTGGTDTSFNPAAVGATLRGGANLQPAIIRLTSGGVLATNVAADATRKLALVEVAGPGGPLEVLVNNTKWNGTLSPNAGGITEMPRVGSTEVWEIINLTADAHPIHIHLTQFQLISRQAFNVTAYRKAYDALFPGGAFNGVTYPAGVFMPAYGPPKPYSFYAPTTPGGPGWFGGNPDVTPYLQDGINLPDPNENGWKDTFKMFPGEVTRVVVRWAPQDIAVNGVAAGTNLYPFDPTTGGPGYVWHCHILDHEDNEMMRPYTVAP
jgi:spore coat protein A, manganese oxidase